MLYYIYYIIFDARISKSAGLFYSISNIDFKKKKKKRQICITAYSFGL